MNRNDAVRVTVVGLKALPLVGVIVWDASILTTNAYAKVIVACGRMILACVCGSFFAPQSEKPHPKK
jgi:hypothetical protein